MLFQIVRCVLFDVALFIGEFPFPSAIAAVVVPGGGGEGPGEERALAVQATKQARA